MLDGIVLGARDVVVNRIKKMPVLSNSCSGRENTIKNNKYIMSCNNKAVQK